MLQRMLQASWQSITKSQKTHTESHDGLPNFPISTLINIGLRATQIVDKVARMSLSLTKYEVLSSTRYFILGLQSIH